ncbi:MAG TPA: hypothetical protein VFC78_11330 [Tepidisphaeraceae bacterium]|nr:hypothetical protein [Tepidisphaeraceae bacterium]
MTDTPDETEPSTPAGNGDRAHGGRFAVGNKAGKGNPNNRRAQLIRNAIIKAVKPADMALAAKALLEQAKGGDRQAFAELADRICGKPIPMDLEQRIADLEEALESKHE